MLGAPDLDVCETGTELLTVGDSFGNGVEKDSAARTGLKVVPILGVGTKSATPELAITLALCDSSGVVPVRGVCDTEHGVGLNVILVDPAGLKVC